MVALTPPPGVATAVLQSILVFLEGRAMEVASVAAISTELKGDEVVVGFFAVGISAGDEVRSVITTRGPD